jgi:hypothetical protein
MRLGGCHALPPDLAALMDDERWPLGASVLSVLVMSLALWALISPAVRVLCF